MDRIERLGDLIASIWLNRGNADDAFAAVASDALVRSEVLKPGLEAEIAREFLISPRLPEQQFRSFGQPALTLYKGHKFYIELLYWLDSTTAIHQHSFAGAFGVVAGSSVHTKYSFRCKDSVSSEILLGELHFQSAELLRPGDVREILPGNQCIHSLFHLERPSTTLVVRTNTLPTSAPQYSYRKPGIGYDPFFKPEPFTTRLLLLEALRAFGDGNVYPLACEMMPCTDLWMAYGLMSVVRPVSHTEAGWTDLVVAARERHGSQIDIFLQSLDERQRERNIVARRNQISNADHRFFLALVLNVPDREAIYELIAYRHPSEAPESMVLRWISELAAQGTIGLEFDALSLKMLQHILRDLSLSDMKAGLTAAFGPDNVREEGDRLGHLWNEICSNSLLRPLVTPGVNR